MEDALRVLPTTGRHIGRRVQAGPPDSASAWLRRHRLGQPPRASPEKGTFEARMFTRAGSLGSKDREPCSSPAEYGDATRLREQMPQGAARRRNDPAQLATAISLSLDAIVERVDCVDALVRGRNAAARTTPSTAMKPATSSARSIPCTNAARAELSRTLEWSLSATITALKMLARAARAAEAGSADTSRRVEVGGAEHAPQNRGAERNFVDRLQHRRSHAALLLGELG